MQVSAFCRSSSFFFALAVVILVGLFAAGSPAVNIDDVHHCFPGHTPALSFSSSSPSPPPITTTLCFVLCSASRTVALGSFSVDLGSEIQQCVKPRMIFPALNTRNVLLVSSSDQIPTVDTTMGIRDARASRQDLRLVSDDEFTFFLCQVVAALMVNLKCRPVII